MPHNITSVTVRDIRTPTSRTQAGSDAMHTDPDYSAAYVILGTDHSDGLEGHGLTFTIGRGNEVCVAAANALAPLVMGMTIEAIAADMRGFWRRLTGESQLRWIGPEKGAIHLATAAIVNAAWDLWAKVNAQAGLEAGRRHDARGDRRMRRFPLSHRCARRRRSARDPAPQRADARQARSRDDRQRLSRLHHLGRMDGLFG